jgi:hypothetical protein
MRQSVTHGSYQLLPQYNSTHPGNVEEIGPARNYPSTMPYRTRRKRAYALCSDPERYPSKQIFTTYLSCWFFMKRIVLTSLFVTCYRAIDQLTVSTRSIGQGDISSSRPLCVQWTLYMYWACVTMWLHSVAPHLQNSTIQDIQHLVLNMERDELVRIWSWGGLPCWPTFSAEISTKHHISHQKANSCSSLSFALSL